jgi:hypothetical protein
MGCCDYFYIYTFLKCSRPHLLHSLFSFCKGDDNVNIQVESLCRNTWIGVHKKACGQPWIDVSGVPLSYFKWAAGEPNNRQLPDDGTVGQPVVCDDITDRLWQGSELLISDDCVY